MHLSTNTYEETEATDDEQEENKLFLRWLSNATRLKTASKGTPFQLLRLEKNKVFQRTKSRTSMKKHNGL